MKTILLYISLAITLNTFAQETIQYKGAGNTSTIEYIGEDSIPYYKANNLVRSVFYRITGQWQVQEDSELSFTIQYDQKMYECYSYEDKCAAYNIVHPDFENDFEMRLTLLDSNELTKICFSLYSGDLSKPNTTYNKSYLGVGGYIYILDDNTMRMEILSCPAVYSDGSINISDFDFLLDTAPQVALDQIPKVFKKGPYTLKRVTSTGKPTTPGDEM